MPSEPHSEAAERLRQLVVPDPLAPADQSDEACASRLRLALQLSDDGVEMMRMNLRRRHPAASHQERERILEDWLRDRPGARLGDGWGRPAPHRRGVKPLHDLLVQVSRDLSGSRWALVGGLAVGARTEPRFTRDLDLAVSVSDDAAAEALVRRMLGRQYGVVAVLEQTATGRLATVRLAPPDQDSRLVDLLFASSGIEPEVVREAQVLELSSGTRAPVARIGHLIAMKVLARDDRSRPQDRIDLIALLGASDQDERTLAREALIRMTERSYHRGRNLLLELNEFLRELG